MRKNKFFDVIMISLILMCSFKLLYPDAFTFNVIVNTSASGSSQGSQDKLDLPEYSSIAECMNEYIDATFCPCSSLDGDTPGGDTLYCNSRNVNICMIDSQKCYSLTSSDACFYINGELWYQFDIFSYVDDDFGFGYFIDYDCDWICNNMLI